jgi:hypothetical protein
MGTETQHHALKDGTTLTISRNGNHQYWLDDGVKVPSVTGLLGHIDSDGFGTGMGWAMKIAREHDGDLDAPRRVSKEAMDSGTALHDDIDQYIKDGTVAEGNPAFVAWMHEVGERTEWVAAEQFVFSEAFSYGGTADAFSMSPERGSILAPIPGDSVIWDWKTKNPESYAKYGGSVKDHAQLAAYGMALREMDSILAPASGYIAYVMRDGSGVDVVPVDLEQGWKLFKASRTLSLLVKASK